MIPKEHWLDMVRLRIILKEQHSYSFKEADKYCNLCGAGKNTYQEYKYNFGIGLTCIDCDNTIKRYLVINKEQLWKIK